MIRKQATVSCIAYLFVWSLALCAPARAQVTIEERVEIGLLPSTKAGIPAKDVKAVATSVPGGLTVISDGYLRIRYQAAWQTYEPIAGVLSVNVTGRVIEDAVSSRFSVTSAGTIEEFCVGSGGINEPSAMPVTHYTPSDDSVLDLGYVRAGDVIQIRFIESEQTGGQAEILGLDHFNTRIDGSQSFSVSTLDPFACNLGDPATGLNLSIEFDVIAYLKANFTASKILPGNSSRVHYTTVDGLGEGVNKDPFGNTPFTIDIALDPASAAYGDLLYDGLRAKSFEDLPFDVVSKASNKVITFEADPLYRTGDHLPIVIRASCPSDSTIRDGEDVLLVRTLHGLNVETRSNEIVHGDVTKLMVSPRDQDGRSLFSYVANDEQLHAEVENSELGGVAALDSLLRGRLETSDTLTFPFADVSDNFFYVFAATGAEPDVTSTTEILVSLVGDDRVSGSTAVKVRPPFFTISPGTIANGDTTALSVVARNVHEPGFNDNFNVELWAETSVGRFISDEGLNEWHGTRFSSITVPYAVADPAYARARYGAEQGRVQFVANDTPPAGHRVLLANALYIAADGFDWEDRYKTGHRLISIGKESALSLLRQNDALIPTEEEDPSAAVLMVSKFRTDRSLGKSVGFESPFSGSEADSDTFRPQVTGVDEVAAVGFRIQTIRYGQPSGYDEIFSSVQGTLPDGQVAFRGDQHLRLVSNARPTSAPSGALYDDEVAERQTILVELEDTLRVTLLLDGEETDVRYELPVGRPASEDGPHAVRRATLHWATLEGLNSAPDVITRRMSEDWAQAGVYFRKKRETTFEKVAGVVQLEFKRRGPLLRRSRPDSASSPGTLNLEMHAEDGASTPISVSYKMGDRVHIIAFRLRQAIAEATGLDIQQTEMSPTSSEKPSYFVYLRAGVELTFENPTSSDDIRISKYNINLRAIETPEELNIVGETAKDGDIETIDVVVLPDRSLPANNIQNKPSGKSAGDQSPFPGLQNTMFVEASAADENDGKPFVAGHEAGHILFDREFRGSDPADPGHSSDPENLMFWTSVEVENPSAPKRLTLDQQKDARTDSGPGFTNSGPILLKALSKREK